jgi:hypothetical protein
MVSTPPATNTSPSPAAIACAAVFTACSPEPHEIEDAKNQLDDITFAQEYLAEDVDVNDRPFFYAFNESKHQISEYEPNPHLPLLVSFDFNKDPMTCIISQSVNVRHCRIFDEIKMKDGSTPEICDILLAKYNRFIDTIEVTGDATGRNRSPLIQGNINHYLIIREKLGLLDSQIKVRKQNMSHKNSRILCNSVLQNADFAITANCRETLMDMLYTSVDERGEILKSQDQGRHFSDNVRYTIDAVFPKFIESPQLYDL